VKRAWVFLLAVVAVNLMNLADWFFTMHALPHGATELNPVLDYMIKQDVINAFLFKTSIVLAATLYMWSNREDPFVQKGMLVAVGVFSALMVYQVWGLYMFT
jgi:hypothetical protein